VHPTDDTIVAIATPPGHGGVGIVRLSGPAADRIARTMAGRGAAWPPRRATRARVSGAGLVAEALVTHYPAPRSYTGDDVIELSAHGSPVVLAALVEQTAMLGARLAQPGEFTLRAFLNGKLDLVQAEAARDIVDAVSPAQARAAFDQLDGTLSSALNDVAGAMRELELKLEASMDFPDEGYHFIERTEVGEALERIRRSLSRLVDTGARGQVVREGARVVITGTPNAGKSSLFNALVGADRAIVAATPGTTRDLVTARVVLADYAVELVDTAGIRESGDAVEQEGVRRADGAVDHADVVIVAVDRSRAASADDLAVIARGQRARAVMVATKADLTAAWPTGDLDDAAIAVSARTGAGVADVVAAVARRLGAAAGGNDHVLITNVRHRALLSAALAHIAHACDEFAARQGELPEEFVAADVQQALGALDEVTGRRTPDDLLKEIFGRFCIGK
jgi:tRNA modification GTPase